MLSSILAGLRADLRSSCLFPNGWQALSKDSQIRGNRVNRKVPRTWRVEKLEEQHKIEC